MGVFAGRGAQIDVLAISDTMRNSVRQWETCRIVILDPGKNSVNFAQKSDAAFVWTGWARVQPYRREIAVAVPADPTVTQTYRFQVDFTKDGVIPLIRSGYRIIALPESLGNIPQPDPQISDYEHVVNSAVNSSLAWQRTIETITNLERRPDYEFGLDDDGNLVWV